ncbi:hypothetical protein FHG87_002010 [Trinorchestia longiramus]|nr:hypothetical protein FHG87_002010 [Trinorchestia longiramus]
MPPPPDQGRGAATGRASSSSRPSRASLLPQSQSSSKSRTSSPATAISQPNHNAPNPKPLTTLQPPPFPSTPTIPSRPAKAPTYRVQLKTIDLAKPTDKQKFFEMTFRELNAPLIRLTTTRTGNYAVTDDVTSIDKCLNCQGPHRTPAANCPYRKNIVRQKKKPNNDRNKNRLIVLIPK